MKFLRKLLLYFLFITWLFNIKYTFIPLNPTLLIGILGGFFLIVDYNSFNGLSRKLVIWVLLIGSIGLSIFPSKMINPNLDFYYVYENMLVPMIQSCGIYIFYKVIKRIYHDVKIEHFINLWIGVVLIQSILTLLINLIPSFQSFLFTLVKYSEGEAIVKASLERSYRFIGFGTQFFGAGVVYSITLIVMLYKMAIIKKKRMRLFLQILFVFIIGMLLSRTTIVGLVLGFLLFVHKKYFLSYKDFKKFIVKGLPLVLTIIGICIVGLIFAIKHTEIKESPLYFALELFINLQNGKGLTTGSSDRMFEMYNVIPDNFVTWTFGDGLFKGVYNVYYKGIDIGFLRIIFAVGIIGLLVNILVHLKLTYSSFKITKEHRWLFLYLFLLYLILLSKGMVSFIPFIIYFLVGVFLTYSTSKVHLKNNNYE